MKKKCVILVVLWLMSPVLLFAQTGIIKGLVADENGDPLVAANVIIKGTVLGSTTNMSGLYEITVPVGTYSVMVTYMGYKPNTIDGVVVGPNQTVTANFTMLIEVLMGQQVVVIGYGTQKKTDVTSSVSSVNMVSYEKVPTPSTTAALQGKAAGVNVEFATGAPYSDPLVKIRGIGTISTAAGANDPLYVIDGVPTNVNYLDPQDIEAIDILKDAAAAAIYGSRAANGVILITTKRGKTNSPVKIDFRSYYGTQTLDKIYDVMSSKQYAEHMIRMYDNAELTPPQILYDVRDNPQGYPNTNWQRTVFNDAPTSKYELSLTGGGEWFNFNISGSWADRQGMLVTTGQTKASLRMNSDLIKGKFKFGESISIGRVKEDYQNDAGWEAGYRYIASIPFIPVYDPNMPGGYGMPDVSKGVPHGAGGGENPFAFDDAVDLTGNYNHSMASVYGEYEPVHNLKYRLQVSQNVEEYHEYDFGRPWGAILGDEGYNWLSEIRSRREHSILETTLNYALDLGNHSMSALAGYAREQVDWRNITGSVQKLPSNETNVLDAGTLNPALGGAAWSDRLESIFARFNYSFASKYLAQFNVRRDGSSRFNKEDRYGLFPSGSVGWRISKEPFFKSVPYVSDLKLRASYGVLGNNQIARYAYLPSIYINPGDTEFAYVFGTGQTVYTGAAIPDLAASRIKWEETKTMDVGFDLAMFKDKLEFSADYYIRKTSDMLLNVPLPWCSGVWQGPVTNIGEMENKGFEFAMRYRNYEQQFKYAIEANLTTYKNKLIKLSGVAGDALWGGFLEYGDTNPVTKTVVGREVAQFYLWKTGGLFQSQAEIDAYTNSEGAKLQPDAKPGDMKFLDINGDGLLTDDDRVFMGSAIPSFETGIGVTLNYRGFDLSMFLHGSFGRKLFNATRWIGERATEWENQLVEVTNSWTPTNTNTDIPRATYGDPNNNARPSDRFLEDASYVRIRNLEIGYTIPRNAGFMSTAGLNKIRLFVSAENLLTITDYSGYDPGISGGSLFARGVDFAVYPLARIYLSGVEISF